MRLIVDTSVLVGELLRAKGRDRLGDDRMELFLAEQLWGEAAFEMPRRIAAFVRARKLDAGVGEELTELCLGAIGANIVVIDEAVYAPLEDEALARSVRDPNNWPVVACALALSAGIWTNDNDFLGTGAATWTTATLQLCSTDTPNSISRPEDSPGSRAGGATPTPATAPVASGSRNRLWE